MPHSNPGASASFSRKRLLVALAAATLLGAAGYFLSRGDAAPPPPSPSPEQQPPPRSRTIVLFQTEPPGALVSLDGNTLGISPLTLESVVVGEHEVSATMEGRQDTTQSVTISPQGEHAHVMIVLPEAPEDAGPPDEGG